MNPSPNPGSGSTDPSSTNGGSAAAATEQSQYNPEVDYTQKVSRFSAARYTMEVCHKLNSNVLTTATALTYFHRFYQQTTFEEYDPFTIGCTCIYLASKIVDDDIRIRDIINVGLNCIKRNAPPLMLDPYFIMRDSLTQAELLLMRVLEFKLRVELPHKYLLHYLKALKDWLGEATFTSLPITKTAWSVLQDTYHDELVIKQPPELLATASLHVALELYGVTVPSELPDPWYTVLHESCTYSAVSDLALKIFDLYEREKSLVLWSKNS